jgi:hypothetical protein
MIAATLGNTLCHTGRGSVMARFTRDAPFRPDSVRVHEQGELWVEVAERKDGVAMTFHGTLDEASLDCLHRLLHAAEYESTKPVLADFADAAFGRGRALQLLVYAAVGMEGRLTVRGAPPAVQELVALTTSRRR